MKRIRTAAQNRSRERVAGMEIETYGTEVGEEFDYDDEDNDESMYPGEKEVMVRRAIEEYVLRKRQELEAGKSKKKMPAATPNLSSLKI